MIFKSSMDAYPERSNNEADNEETYVFLDLDDVCIPADIPANASYVLSGLDTLNPMLVISDRMKFIGEYQETIGTCYVFTENGRSMATQANERTSEANSSKEKHVGDENKLATKKEVKPVATLHKVLKFRLASESQSEECFNAATM